MRSSKWRNDAAATRTTRQFQPAQESRPGSSDAASNRSRQWASGPVAQFLQSVNAFYPFARRRKLPGWIMLDALVFAHLGHAVGIALYATLDIRSELERPAELFLLLLAMRTPVRTVHLDSAIGQTACKRIMFMFSAIIHVKHQSDCGRSQHRVNRNTSPVRTGSLNPEFVFLSFSALLRHEVLYHEFLYHEHSKTKDLRLKTVLAPPQTTTRNAEGSTSMTRHSSVSTSPSAITSTGP